MTTVQEIKATLSERLCDVVDHLLDTKFLTAPQLIEFYDKYAQQKDNSLWKIFLNTLTVLSNQIENFDLNRAPFNFQTVLSAGYVREALLALQNGFVCNIFLLREISVEAFASLNRSQINALSDESIQDCLQKIAAISTMRSAINRFLITTLVSAQSTSSESDFIRQVRIELQSHVPPSPPMPYISTNPARFAYAHNLPGMNDNLSNEERPFQP